MQLVRSHPQASLCCPCGAVGRLTAGLCTLCYGRRRRDASHFAGLREPVLRRDSYCCQGCGRQGAGKRMLAVHHRRPAVSRLGLMVSLCPACHARVHRTRVLRKPMGELLRELWAEQHPDGAEQLELFG